MEEDVTGYEIVIPFSCESAALEVLERIVACSIAVGRVVPSNYERDIWYNKTGIKPKNAKY